LLSIVNGWCFGQEPQASPASHCTAAASFNPKVFICCIRNIIVKCEFTMTLHLETRIVMMWIVGRTLDKLHNEAQMVQKIGTLKKEKPLVL